MQAHAVSQLTFDQLLLFVTVSETGSFSGAAKRLGRVQSTVSHGIAQLESQLDVRLFDRSTRKPSLTPAGQHLLLQAQQILNQVQDLKSSAQLLQTGHEPFVSVVMDMIIPVEIMTRSLRQVQKKYPQTRWLLHTEMLGAITQRVIEGNSQLGLTGQLLPQYRAKLISEPLGQVEFMLVVAPIHALAKLAQAGESITARQLAAFTQLAVLDREDALMPEGDRWYLGDLQTLLHFAKEGFGWAFLPQHLVQPALDAGQLVSLQLANRPALQSFTIYSISLKSERPGPVRLALQQALKQAFAKLS